MFNRDSRIYFVGIGGIGMSALAAIFATQNIKVSGSNICEDPILEKLRQKGITVFIGHDKNNIDNDIDVVITTNVIKEDNPEIIAAKEKGIPIIFRKHALKKLADSMMSIGISGVHGKTSVSAMIFECLKRGGFDPNAAIGGIVKSYNSNYNVGKSNIFVFENDESDGCCIEASAKIRVLTNIEPDHLDYHGTFEAIKELFDHYIAETHKDGAAFMCINNKEVYKLYSKYKKEKKLITYAYKAFARERDGLYADIKYINFLPEAETDYFSYNLKRSKSHSGWLFDTRMHDGSVLKDLQISYYCEHAVQNMTAAIAICDYLGMDHSKIRNVISECNGVERRFMKLGDIDGALILEDYAHHPTELYEVFRECKHMASVRGGKFIAVFQPHKYSRLKDFLDEFVNTMMEPKISIITPVHKASEDPSMGVDSDHFAELVKKRGHKSVFRVNNYSECKRIIEDHIKTNDVIMYAGAGSDVVKWGREFSNFQESRI